MNVFKPIPQYPPRHVMVDIKSIRSINQENGCPKCKNKSLVAIPDRNMAYDVATYCGRCDIQYDFISLK